ncbi:shikimate kinase [Paenibacillus sp. y28]|uniref:shikimate kinase n=1 Tax=Paenibacillus sp. y28 TaxID=3129110 RepID=UPI00301B0E5F
MQKQNIVLVGFMGCGKTSVGKALAAKLAWTHTDIDELVVQREGISISSLFAERGEAAFRAIESSIIEETMQGQQQVISTGGGAVLAEANRQAMLDKGLVVTLKADKATIIARVQNDASRPLLQGNLEERVEQLLQQRSAAYDFADVIIDTTPYSVEEIVDRIVSEWDRITGGI